MIECTLTAPIESAATVKEYSLKLHGKHIRYATCVTFPNGPSVNFLEPMTNGSKTPSGG